MVMKNTVSGNDIDFVDSHLHLDLLWQEVPSRIPWLARAGCLPVSWSFGRDIGSLTDLKQYFKLKSKAIKDINDNYLQCFFLIGVHPRNIPPDLKPEQVKGLILPYLDDPLCLGIGEIGLETGTNQEEEIFRAQMGLAEEVYLRGKTVGIHTPRRDKVRVTDRIVAILERFLQWKERIVVDHCTLETVGTVLAVGCWAGVTLSPPKSSTKEVAEIVERHPEQTGRIMLNTDSGNPFYEDLYDFCRSKALTEQLRNDLARENACRFFGIE